MGSSTWVTKPDNLKGEAKRRKLDFGAELQNPRHVFIVTVRMRCRHQPTFAVFEAVFEVDCGFRQCTSKLLNSRGQCEVIREGEMSRLALLGRVRFPPRALSTVAYTSVVILRAT